MRFKSLVLAAGLLGAAAIATTAAAQSPAFNESYVGIRAEVIDVGLQVAEVWADSPAAKAGIQKGDVLVSIGTTPLRTMTDFSNAVSKLSPGESADFTILRDGTRSVVAVQVGRRPGRAAGSRGQTNMIGFQVQDTDTGTAITDVDPDSPAARSGICGGDIVTGINGQPVDSAEAYNKILRECPPNHPITFTVNRGGEAIDVAMALPRRMGLAGAAGASRGMGAIGKALGLSLRKNKEGLAIGEVAHQSPAERAGVKPGDIISGLNGEAVQSDDDFARRLRRQKAGSEIELTVLREGKEIRLPLVLTGQPEGAGASERGAEGAEPAGEVDGIEPGEHGPHGDVGRIGFHAEPTALGILVARVDMNTPAAKAGLKAGDIVRRVNGQPVDSTAAFEERMNGFEIGAEVTVEVERHGEPKSLNFKMARIEGGKAKGKTGTPR